MMDAVSNWLIKQITSGQLKTEDSLLIDVGAYRGDFTKSLLPFMTNAILFEANQNNFLQLQSIFANSPVSIHHLAIGDHSGSISFFCSEDAATGSLLPYAYTSAAINETQVQLTTLDECLASYQQKISIIKIDTQGNDLNVLKGATNIIAKHQPCLVVELIYLPLYESQAKPSEIISFLAERGYVQAGLFNIHYSHDGWLAFADGIFVPTASIKKVTEPFYLDTSAAQAIIEENIFLKQACDERLALIQQMDMALKKQNVIKKLWRKLRSPG